MTLRSYVVTSGLAMLGLAILGLAAVALAQSKPAAPPAAAGATPPRGTPPAAAAAAAKAKSKTDEAAIRQLVDQFVKAYNAGDTAAVGACFARDAELVDEEEKLTLQGREAIQQLFGDVFGEHPNAKIEVQIDAIRFLTPSLAIEEGVSKVTHEPGEPAESGRYTVLHVKEDGKWQMASVHDLADDEEIAKSELDQLAWLVEQLGQREFRGPD